MDKYNQLYFQHLYSVLNQAKATPLNLGGVLSASGGAGGPPGGFVGSLAQTRIAYDTTEAALSGWVSDTPTISGVLVNASLLDNLNHIRYRINDLELYGIPGNITVQEDDIVVASGVTVLNFEGYVNTTVDGLGKVTVLVTPSGGGTFTDLTDTPDAYTGQAGKAIAVNNGETELQFVTISGLDGNIAVQDSGAFEGNVNTLNFDSNLSVTVTDNVATIDTDYEGHGAFVRRTTSQSINTGTNVAITWDTEDYDDNNYWDSGTAGRFTIPENGWYVLTLDTRWQDGTYLKYVNIRLNGSNYLTAVSNTENVGRFSTSLTRYFVSGDYLQGVVYHTYGSARNVTSAKFGISKAGGGSGGSGIGLDYSIYLYDLTGETVSTYDADSTGMAAAIAAASSGDVIQIPNAEIGGNHTIPAGVSVLGLSRHKSVLTGIIVLSNGSVLENLTVSYSANSSATVYAVILASSAVSYIYSCNILCIQAGSGIAYGISITNNGSSLECWGSSLRGTSASNTGYALYRNTTNDTTAYVYGGRAQGDVSPFLES